MKFGTQRNCTGPVLLALIVFCAASPVFGDNINNIAGKVNFIPRFAPSETIDIENYRNRFDELDQHALDAPRSVRSSLETLAEYLIAPAKTDLEKVRVIYRWITDNIAYDTDAYFSGRYGDLSAGGVLQSGKSVCSGYSGLFKNLLDLAGVNSVEINGYAKGYGYREGDSFSRTNHAWNGVEIGGKWYLIDSTWASGSVNGRTYNKKHQEFWFFTPPEQFIFSHFPTEEEWQLLAEPISKPLFELLPNLKHQLFNTGITFEMVAKELNNPGFREFPYFYYFKYNEITVTAIPMSKYLEQGKEYYFELSSPDLESMAIIQGRDFFYFDKNGDTFSITFTPKTRGKLKVSYSTEGKYKNHWELINYKVE